MEVMEDGTMEMEDTTITNLVNVPATMEEEREVQKMLQE